MLTVTTPSTNKRLTTLSAVHTELNNPSHEHDPVLQGYIDAASAAIESFCNVAFARETGSETFRLSQRNDGLVLTRHPVVSVTSIEENGVALTQPDYEIDLESGVVYRLRDDLASRWFAGKVIVTYQAGYVLPGFAGRNLPADIERAAIMMVVASYTSRGRDPLLKHEEVTNVGAVDYYFAGSDGMSPEVSALLKSWREVTI